MDHASPPPFAGLKVLDLSQGIAGPYCAEILLQQGATVTKVEPPTGDWGRGIGFGVDGMSALAVANNLGKRSICIDAATPRGRELLQRMAREADVIVESFRPGVMDRLGLSYAALAEADPRLVYVSVTGFGPDGPYVDRPGTDSVLQALSGLMVANRDESGMPRKVGILMVDVVTGVYAANAAATALYRRATQGKGAHVQVSLLEGAAAVQGNSIVDSVLGRGQPPRPVSVPAGTFATADGFINVTSLHDRMFAGLCRATGKDEWISDPRLASPQARFEHAAEINQALAEVFRGNTNAHWLETLGRNDVICGPVCGYEDFLADPQVRHMGVFEQVPHGGELLLPVPRVPGTPRDARLTPAPRAGADTRAVLAELGLGAAEIAELFEAGVVREPG